MPAAILATPFGAVQVNLMLAVAKRPEEDKRDEKDCADPGAGIPDRCWMCDDT
jgi:hypothetical protein